MDKVAQRLVRVTGLNPGFYKREKELRVWNQDYWENSNNLKYTDDTTLKAESEAK